MGRALSYVAYRFIVIGTGYFPVDMLRYDRCVPYSQGDVAAMMTNEPRHLADRVEREDFTKARQVELIAYTPRGHNPAPTAARWESFGWRVLENSVKRIDV